MKRGSRGERGTEDKTGEGKEKRNNRRKKKKRNKGRWERRNG